MKSYAACGPFSFSADWQRTLNVRQDSSAGTLYQLLGYWISTNPTSQSPVRSMVLGSRVVKFASVLAFVIIHGGITRQREIEVTHDLIDGLGKR